MIPREFTLEAHKLERHTMFSLQNGRAWNRENTT